MVHVRKTAYHGNMHHEDPGLKTELGDYKIHSSKKSNTSVWKELKDINWNWFSFALGFTCLFSSVMIIVLTDKFGNIQPTEKIEEQNQMIEKIQTKRKQIYHRKRTTVST
jgi:hypothetical protein